MNSSFKSSHCHAVVRALILALGILGCRATGLTCLGQEFVTPIDFSSLVSARQESTVTRTRPVLVDVDEDGVVDVQIAAQTGSSHKAIEYVQPASGNWLTGPTRVFVTGPVFAQLPVVEYGPSAVGELVQPGIPEPAVTNRMFRMFDSLSTGGSQTSWGATNTSLYVGLVFRRADGWHAGWVHFTRTELTDWTLSDRAWDPVPGRALAVGLLPPPTTQEPRVYASTYTVFPVKSAAVDVDLVLAQRTWTNAITHDHGLEVWLQGPASWNWYLDAAASTNQAAPLKERTPLPPADSPAIRRAAASGGVLIYSETIPKSGTTVRTGPLASATSAYFGFVDTAALAAGQRVATGWARVRRPGWDVSVARSASAVGAPELQFGYLMSNAASNLDLNGDGLIDFVLGTEYVGFSFFTSNSDTLFPLPGAGFLQTGSGTVAPATSTDEASGHSAWSTNGVVVRGYSGGGGIFFTLGITSSSRIGLRVPAEDGTHYGWQPVTVIPPQPMQGLSAQVNLDPPELDPWPDEAVRLGSPAPGPLRVTLDAGQLPVLTWPAALQVGVQERFVEPGAEWHSVTPTDAGRFTPEVTRPAALYRLHP